MSTDYKKWINLDQDKDPKEFIKQIDWALDHVRSMEDSHYFTSLAINSALKSVRNQIREYIDKR